MKPSAQSHFINHYAVKAFPCFVNKKPKWSLKFEINLISHGDEFRSFSMLTIGIRLLEKIEQRLNARYFSEFFNFEKTKK